VDITQTFAIKQQAIRKHSSQLAYKAYDAGTLGRNRYEAVFLETHEPEKCKYVEIVLDMGDLLQDSRLSLEDFAEKLLQGLPVFGKN
jgi:hypothetical protein